MLEEDKYYSFEKLAHTDKIIERDENIYFRCVIFETVTDMYYTLEIDSQFKEDFELARSLITTRVSPGYDNFEDYIRLVNNFCIQKESRKYKF